MRLGRNAAKPQANGPNRRRPFSPERNRNRVAPRTTSRRSICDQSKVQVGTKRPSNPTEGPIVPPLSSSVNLTSGQVAYEPHLVRKPPTNDRFDTELNSARSSSGVLYEHSPGRLRYALTALPPTFAHFC
jgi:hypothetical protein